MARSGPPARGRAQAVAAGRATRLVLADLVARTALRPAEVPLGIVTAATGRRCPTRCGGRAARVSLARRGAGVLAVLHHPTLDCPLVVPLPGTERSEPACTWP